MPAAESSARVLRARLAATRRHHPDADVTDLKRQLTAQKLEEFITRTVAAAPPLTDAQRGRLASLLQPSGGRRAS